MRVYIPIVFLLTGLSSCCTKRFDTKVTPLNSNAYYTCNQSLNLDSVAVSARLIGSWKPHKSYNIWTDETTTIRSTATTTFDTDSTYTFTNDNGEVIKGSARSVNGVNITSLLRSLKTPFLGIGGHDQAAGLQAVEDVVDLALADMPDMAELVAQSLMQLVPVVRLLAQQAQQGIFRRERAGGGGFDGP